MSGSPDISNPKPVTSTKETAAAATTLEISPESSFLNLAATTLTDLLAAVSLVIMGLFEKLLTPGQVT